MRLFLYMSLVEYYVEKTDKKLKWYKQFIIEKDFKNAKKQLRLAQKYNKKAAKYNSKIFQHERENPKA